MDQPSATAAPLPKPPKSKLRRWTVRILRGAALIYLGVIIVIFFLQSKLIFPGTERQGQRDTVLVPSQRYELLSLSTQDGQKITAIFGSALDPLGQPRPDAAHRPTVVYFYGNYSCMADASDQFDHFRRLGFNVIVPDYLGYGMSTGSASETNCYATADAAYNYLLTRKDIDPNKIVAAGWSLGAAVAVDLASRKPIHGLITFSGFTRMRDMAHLVIPWIPTSLILRHHFDNLAKIPTLNCPILIMHGTSDQIIPPEMSTRLAAAAKAPVTKVMIPGADHNNIFDVGGAGLMNQVSEFVEGIK